jgi:hypothetical protein
MAGYTRYDTSNNIATGNVINAADLDGEFDALVAAFHASTGHVHDGTAANGAPITKLGPAQEYVGNGTSFSPKTTAVYDLGTSSLRWNNLQVVNLNASNTAIEDGIIVSGRSGGTSSYRVSIVPTTLTASRTVTLPDSTGVVILDAVSNIFKNASGQTFLASSTTTQDGIVINGRAGGSSSYRATIVPTTLTASRTITLPDATGTVTLNDAAQTLTNKTVNISSNSVTVDGTNSVGYVNIPQNSRSANYTLVLSDSGKHIFHPSADTTARTFTIPSNASVAFPIGTAVSFINQNAAGVISIDITTDTLRLGGAGTTGTRSLAANGIATAVKVTSTEWIISGTGLT